MPNLDNLLSFAPASSGSSQRTPIPPISSHVLVTDTLDSPASFVLFHFLRAAHAANKTTRSAAANGKTRERDVRIIWLGCNADGISHLRNVARKSGVQIDVEAQKNAFTCINVNDIARSSSEASEAHFLSLDLSNTSGTPLLLKMLYDKVKIELENDSQAITDNVQSWTSDTLIIVDDLSSLSWSLDASDSSGQRIDVAAEISRWIQALSSLALKQRASLITLCHTDATSVGKHFASDSVDESILRSLLRTADVWIEVKELVSGRARDCDGEITVHALVRPSLARNAVALPSGTPLSPHDPPPLTAFKIETPCPSRSKAVLYRIAPDGQGAALGASGAGSTSGRVHVWARGTGRGFL